MHILLTEDSAPVGEALKHLLQHTGFVVDCSRLRDCEAFAESGAYDLVILDYGVAPVHGLTILQELRHADSAVAVLVVGACGGEEDFVPLLEAGADDFLASPFRQAELVAYARAVLRRCCGFPQHGESLRIADLALDLWHQRAMRAGQPLALTFREFQLLEYLLRRAGNVCTRAELLDHVWGLEKAYSESVVEVYVGFLRRKIDRGFAPKLIHTVHGVGYVLTAGI